MGWRPRKRHRFLAPGPFSCISCTPLRAPLRQNDSSRAAATLVLAQRVSAGREINRRSDPFRGTRRCRPPGSALSFIQNPALTRWANPNIALTGSARFANRPQSTLQYAVSATRSSAPSVGPTPALARPGPRIRRDTRAKTRARSLPAAPALSPPAAARATSRD